MRLATVNAFRASLKAAGDLKLVNDALGAALDAATVDLMSALRMTFDRKTDVTETFFVRPGSGLEFGPSGARQWRCTFALKNPFLIANPTLIYAPSIDELDTDPQVIAPTQVIVDRDKGSFQIVGVNLREKFMRATYTSGFAALSGDTNTYDVPAAHAWLSDAANQFAFVHILQTTPELIPVGAEEGQHRVSVSTAARQAEKMVAGKIRFFADAVRSIA